ncbi:MAG: molybdenum cofactor biosynthesis protein MoaE [Anaerolineales bacterium]|nr:molybdenum cofactor biosynthesis protein MoaE [Anaerolineales bacterium]
MKVTVLFFATLKERAGRASLPVTLDGAATVGALKAQLAADLPALAPALPTALVSVNREFAFDSDILRDGDEVALFPPVSGGSLQSSVTAPTIFRITNDPIDLDALVAAITLPTTGAACIFTGMVRAITTRNDRDAIGAHETTRLEYEAYIPMAEAKMKQVADEIRARWPAVEGIAIVQRIGPLDPGTPTVLIACSAAHRDTGVFEAARYGIDRLKEIVPIWKKEIGPKGEVWVEGTYRPTEGNRVG